jgi:hypothetical protein
MKGVRKKGGEEKIHKFERKSEEEKLKENGKDG